MKPTSVSSNLLRLVGLAATLGIATAAYSQQTAPPPSDDGPDPALANMAPSDAAAMQQNAAPGQMSVQTSDQLQISGPPPQQAPAPIVRSAPTAQPVPGQPDDSYNAPPSADPNQPNSDLQADAQVAAGEQALDDANVSSDQAPPQLPDYDQPAAPGDDYMWTPGYWGYADAGYYWVPGVWIVPPYYGALWTPGYWGFWEARYRWHPGYWGLHVGFYGGINYGYGYIGTGYFGGYWHGNAFLYNRAVTNVGFSVSTTNVYSRTVVYNHQTYTAHPAIRTSYNGGSGGIAIGPRPAELAAMHETHTAPLPGQMRLRTSAAQNPQAAFSNNQGRPPMAAQQQPLGGTRTIANSPAEFHQRQPQVQTMPQNRPMQQPTRPQPQPQYRPAPAPRSSPPASRPAPASHADSGKH